MSIEVLTLFIVIAFFSTLSYFVEHWSEWENNKDYFEEDFDEDHALDQVLNDMVEDLDEEDLDERQR